MSCLLGPEALLGSRLAAVRVYIDISPPRVLRAYGQRCLIGVSLCPPPSASAAREPGRRERHTRAAVTTLTYTRAVALYIPGPSGARERATVAPPRRLSAALSVERSPCDSYWSTDELSSMCHRSVIHLFFLRGEGRHAYRMKKRVTSFMTGD